MRQILRVFLTSTILYIITVLEVRASTQTVSNLPLRSVLRDKNGQIEKGYITRPAVVEGLPCKQWLWFRPDGSLNACRLSSTTKIGTLIVPKNSMICLYPSRKVERAWFSRPLTLQGIPCEGSPGGMTTTCFYESGALRMAFLSRPATIQGIPCRKSGLCPLFFFPNGRLKQFTLDAPTTISGKQYPVGYELQLAANGEVIKAAKSAGIGTVVEDMWSHWFGKQRKRP